MLCRTTDHTLHWVAFAFIGSDSFGLIVMADTDLRCPDASRPDGGHGTGPGYRILPLMQRRSVPIWLSGCRQDHSPVR